MDSEEKNKPKNKTIKQYKRNKNATLKKHKNELGGENISAVGGKVIDSGGYGCIFKPALKCNAPNKSRNAEKEITKLMLSHHAKQEYNEIDKYKGMLESIPNYGDYYLLDGITLCEPSKLTESDLNNYKRKCRALNKRGITEANVNRQLDKLLALNIPDGGLDVGNFLKSIKPLSAKRRASILIQLNKSLIELLNNGIVPMNKKNIYHCDIKESNILVKPKGKEKGERKLYTRLIDWGLSTEYDATKGKDIPKALSNRPFQYNLPFSVVLFNPKLHELYRELLIENPNPDYSLVRGFATDYILLWLKERGTGHFKVISEIINYLFVDKGVQTGGEISEDSNMGEYTLTYYYISNYLANVLHKYTIDGELELLDYFNNVFTKNVDVWGLVISYLPILEDLYFNYYKLNEYELKIFQQIKDIFVYFLFESSSTDPIDIEELTQELHELGSTFTRNLIKVEQNNPKTGKQNNVKGRKKTTSTILTDTSASTF